MKLLYRLLVALYGGAIRVAAAAGVPKAQQWAEGRRDWRKNLAEKWRPGGPTLWMHCASLGEFEQGRPVLEALRAARPELRVLLTFFSPSGYAVRKDYAGAELVCYLPDDTAANARDFVALVQPTLAVFVKYELWRHHLEALQVRGVPTVLIAANPRAGQGFDAPLARGWYRQTFALLSAVFTQDEAGAAVARRLGAPRVAVAGDPRFDRVGAIAAAAEPVPHIAAWLAGRPCVVAGSVWPADLSLIEAARLALHEARPDCPLAVIYAPHETSPEHVQRWIASYGGTSYADLEKGEAPPGDTLWIDRVGLLARLYAHADLTYVGGGFGAGVHNTLEAAVWGRRVLLGPKYAKFAEVRGLLAAGGARSLATAGELLEELLAVVDGAPEVKASGARAGAYVQAHRGATARILAELLPLLDKGMTSLHP